MAGKSNRGHRNKLMEVTCEIGSCQYPIIASSYAKRLSDVF